MSSRQLAILNFFINLKWRASSQVTRLPVCLKSKWSNIWLLSYGVIHKLGVMKYAHVSISSSRQSAILEFCRILKWRASSLATRLIACLISNWSYILLLSFGVIHKLGMLKYTQVSISSSRQSAILEFFRILKTRASSLVAGLIVCLISNWSYTRLLSFGVIHKLRMPKNDKVRILSSCHLAILDFSQNSKKTCIITDY